MTLKRYCGRCDRDTFPTPDSTCSDCGSPMPLTKLPALTGVDLLLQSRKNAAASRLTKRQIKMLSVAGKHGAVLGTWNNQDLVDLRRAGFVTSIELWNATGKRAGSYLWPITDSGRRFLQQERAAG